MCEGESLNCVILYFVHSLSIDLSGMVVYYENGVYHVAMAWIRAFTQITSNRGVN